MANNILLCNNFVNNYQTSNGIVYKNSQSPVGWNGFFKGISPFSSYVNGSNVSFTPPQITNPNYNGANIQFTMGLSSYKSINSIYNNLQYGLYFSLGPNGNVINLIINGTIQVSDPINYNNATYQIGFFDKNLQIINNNEVLYSTPVNTGSLSVDFPLYFCVYTYNNYTYPLLFNVDFIGYPQLAVTNITPNINNPISLTTPITFTFNNPLNPNLINTENVLYNQENFELTDYNIEIINTYNVKLNFSHPREFNTIYNIIFNNIEDSYGNNFTGTFNFITLPNNNYSNVNNAPLGLSFTASNNNTISNTLNYNTNVSSSYWTLLNLNKLLDIDDTVSIQKFSKFNYSFNPSTFNPISNDFDINTNANLNFNNQQIILNLYQNQFAHYFLNFLESLVSTSFSSSVSSTNEENLIPIISQDQTELLKLVSFIIKNMQNINTFKGTQNQINFLLNLLGFQYNSYSNYSSSNSKFSYDVFTAIPPDIYLYGIEENTHPLGFYYNFIPLQGQTIGGYVGDQNMDIRNLENQYLFNTEIIFNEFNYYG